MNILSGNQYFCEYMWCHCILHVCVHAHYTMYPSSQTFIVPASDYRSVREKLAMEKRNSRRALSTLLSKTRPSHPVAGTTDASGLYTG